MRGGKRYLSTGGEVGDGDPALAPLAADLDVAAADAGVVDEDVAVGVPSKQYGRILLLHPIPIAAAPRLLRRRPVEEDVLQHDAALGHRERRDRRPRPRLQVLPRRRCHACACGLVGWAGRGGVEMMTLRLSVCKTQLKRRGFEMWRRRWSRADLRALPIATARILL